VIRNGRDAPSMLVFFKAALAKGLNPTAAVACIGAYVQIRSSGAPRYRHRPQLQE